MRPRLLIGAFGVCSSLAAASGCATSALLEQELTKTNKQTVLAFEETVFNKHEVQEAFQHYVGEGFVEHDPTLAGTAGHESAARAYRMIIEQEGPEAHRAFGVSIAQGQLVMTQSRWSRGARAGGTLSVVDIYRLREGRIVEHWDVSQRAGGEAVPGASLPP